MFPQPIGIGGESLPPSPANHVFFSHTHTELSPSPVLSCCSPLALQYPPLARHLFNAAFVAVWAELTEGQQKHLTDALESALRASTCPTTVLEALLNLAEYMEQTEHPLVRVVGCLLLMESSRVLYIFIFLVRLP